MKVIIPHQGSKASVENSLKWLRRLPNVDVNLEVSSLTSQDVHVGLVVEIPSLIQV